MTFSRSELESDKAEFLKLQNQDEELSRMGLDFVIRSDRYGYAYQWTWCDLPIVQLPQDIVATQEIIFRCKPTVIIETGVAWGGGIALYGTLMDVYGGRRIIGVDLNLAPSVVESVTKVGLKTEVTLIKGSSTSVDIIAQVSSMIREDDRVMVILDSNHTHEHVLDELRTYAPMVSLGQYCIVSDTIVENIPEQSHRPRPWGHGNNPMTAVRQFLSELDGFRPDEDIDRKLVMSFNPSGYLERRL